jgi:hypothetical protein
MAVSLARTIAEISVRLLVPTMRGVDRDVSERKLELRIMRTIHDETRDLREAAYHRGLNEGLRQKAEGDR